MGEVTPVNPKGKTDRQLMIATLKQSEQVHGCVEQLAGDFRRFVAEVRLANLTATEKRQEVAEGLIDVRSDVADLSARQTDDAGKIKLLSQAMGVTPMEAGQKKPSAHVVMNWKELLKVGGSIGGCVGLAIFGFQLLANAWPAIYAYIMSLSPT